MSTGCIVSRTPPHPTPLLIFHDGTRRRVEETSARKDDDDKVFRRLPNTVTHSHGCCNSNNVLNSPKI